MDTIWPCQITINMENQLLQIKNDPEISKALDNIRSKSQNASEKDLEDLLILNLGLCLAELLTEKGVDLDDTNPNDIDKLNSEVLERIGITEASIKSKLLEKLNEGLNSN